MARRHRGGDQLHKSGHLDTRDPFVQGPKEAKSDCGSRSPRRGFGLTLWPLRESANIALRLHLKLIHKTWSVQREYTDRPNTPIGFCISQLSWKSAQDVMWPAPERHRQQTGSQGKMEEFSTISCSLRLIAVRRGSSGPVDLNLR